MVPTGSVLGGIIKFPTQPRTTHTSHAHHTSAGEPTSMNPPYVYAPHATDEVRAILSCARWTRRRMRMWICGRVGCRCAWCAGGYEVGNGRLWGDVIGRGGYAGEDTGGDGRSIEAHIWDWGAYAAS